MNDHAPQSSADALAQEAGRQITILYATTTGNAEDVAERIGREARRRRFGVSLGSLDDYDMANLISESLVLFVVATSGNGDFPTSALSSWRFLLRSELPSDVLEDVTFATFGLGDSSYVRYCWPARKLNKRLKGLGAAELIEGGEADDQHLLGIDGALVPWMDKLWAKMDELVPLPPGIQPLPASQPLPPRIEVSLAGLEAAIKTNGKATIDDASDNRGLRRAKVVCNERMTSSDHWQDVRRLVWVADDDQPIEYEAGDVAVVKPENLPEDVERFMMLVGWHEHADAILELRSSDPTRPLPKGLPRRLTLRRLLTSYLDPFSVPRPSFFHIIRHFAPPGHMEREKLDEFCTPGEGADDMYEYAQRVRRTIAEVLEEFRSVRIPLRYVCEVLPLLREREFSIASGPGHIPNGLELAVAIVQYKTRLKEPRRGVCTKWMARLEPGHRFPFYIKPGSMRLPTNKQTPIVLVGPGTGIAPLRAMVQQRHAQLGEAKADTVVFCGCRHSQRDWLFGEEWRRLQSEGKVEVHLAPSREREEKVYVQDRIREQAASLWDLVGRRGAYIYVCGSAGKMPQAVRSALEEACASHGGMDLAEAERYVTQMEREGRWNEECWS